MVRVFHLNIQSVRNKQLELEAYMSDSKYDILCFSEHFLTNNEIKNFALNKYEIGSYFCRTKTIHGGVVILYKSGLDFNTREDINAFSVESHFEVAAIESVKLNLIIITVYRSPLGDFENFMSGFNSLLNKLRHCKNDIIINGDFNLQFNTNDVFYSDFKDLITSFSFRPTIVSSTRHKNCLDNILVNFNTDFQTDVFDPGLSDHKAITIELTVSVCPVSKTFKTRKFTDEGMFFLYQNLESVNWGFINENHIDIDTKCLMFMDILSNSVNEVFPVIEKKINCINSKSKNPWFTNKLQNKRDYVSLLSELYQNFPDPHLKILISNSKKDYKRDLQDAKSKYYSEYISKNGNTPKTYWEIINKNRAVNRRQTNIDLDVDDLNNYFINVPDRVKLNIPLHCGNFADFLKENSDYPNFAFSNISFNDIRNIINNLKNKQSLDAFNMSVTILKTIKNIIIIPLTKLINQCIAEGVYPEILKISKVIPIHKGGSLTDNNNFRPISLVPIISKVFETVLKGQITTHLENSNILYCNQFGFRSKKSTNDAVSLLINKIVDGQEQNKYVGVTFCDLQKAFDCVSHNILMEKLRLLNFSELSCHLINSYLSNRKQFTCINTSISEQTLVKSGVPQGSVLGPTLFLIYINDLKEAVPRADLLLFADDTTLINSDQTLKNTLQIMRITLSNATNWFNVNSLSLNQAKTVSMVFTHKQLEDFENPVSVKFLGMHLDPTLTWCHHIENVSNKVAKNTFILRTLANLVPNNILVTAYHALIVTHITYGLINWGHSSKTSRVFGLQRRAIRIIGKLGYRECVKQKFKDFKLLTLPSLYIYICLNYTYENIKSFRIQGQLHNHNTRHTFDIRLKYFRLQSSKNGCNYYGPKFFNKLPLGVRNLPAVRFKQVLKTFLIQEAFYSLQEFLDCDIASKIHIDVL